MTPETSPSPFDAAITELEARIRNMQITLETLRQLRAEGGISSAPISPPASGRLKDSEVQHDTFFGMTIGDAAKKYLIMMKVTKPTADIATALEHGGLKHSSKDFPTTVRSVLRQREDFTRVPNGDWGLTEWYPGMGRGKKSAPEKQQPAQAKAKPEPKAKSAEAASSTRRERILTTMQADPGKEWTALRISKATNDPQRKYIQAMLSTMAKEGEIVKSTKGYRLPAKPQAA